MKRTASTDRYTSELALARSAVYRMLSELSFHPQSTERSGEPLSDAPDAQRAELENACAVLADAGFNVPAVRRLAELGGAWFATGRDQLSDEYVRAFGHTVSKQCPPYEAQYGMSHLFEQTQTLADLAGFYRAFGFEVRPGAGERLDHLGVELEFMYILTYKEAYALEHHCAGRAGLCRNAQEKFLGEHLGTWMHDFSSRLAQQVRTGLYALYAEALRDFLAAELTRLAVSPARQRQLIPSPTLPETLSCGLSCGSPSSVPSNPEAGR